MGSMSQEELISWLYQLIDHELDKPEEETDNALIAECSRYLDELQAGDLEMSDTEILARLEQVKKCGAIKKKTRHRFVKVFIPIAATFIMLFLTLSVAASINGTTLSQFISDNLQKISRMAKGESLEEGKITVIKTSGKTTYKSVAELLDKENLDFLFPQPIPDGHEIRYIQIEQVDQDKKITSFILNNLQIRISNFYGISPEEAGGYIEKISHKEMDFYIFTVDSGYSAICQYHGNEYIINSPDLETIKQIISNLKENKK